MNPKQKYTKVFLHQQGKSTNEVSVKQHIPKWWKNTRNKDVGGLRLTDEGFQMLNELEITVYEVPFPKDTNLTVHAIIFLDQFIDSPYYLTPYSIYVTNERKAVELTLFSGDINRYGLTKTMEKFTKSG
jgi:NAD-dependent DNA ligase|tara:strand:+ start:1305 stop:1691 length:387 start_codon:yes stop_codon:yes gene_type:complete